MPYKPAEQSQVPVTLSYHRVQHRSRHTASPGSSSEYSPLATVSALARRHDEATGSPGSSKKSSKGICKGMASGMRHTTCSTLARSFEGLPGSLSLSLALSLPATLARLGEQSWQRLRQARWS